MAQVRAFFLALLLLCVLLEVIPTVALKLKPSSLRQYLLGPLLIASQLVFWSPSPASAGQLEASRFVQRGMQSFREGDIRTSIQFFNKAEEEYPPYGDVLWQRGISLYYNEDYLAGSKQFRRDVALNPLDTEEAIWAFLCEAHLAGGVSEASKHLIRLPGVDRRPFMATIYEAFSSADSRNDLSIDSDKRIPIKGDTRSREYFYACLYSSLLHDVKEEREAARADILKAVESQYAKESQDYMVAVARAQMDKLVKL